MGKWSDQDPADQFAALERLSWKGHSNRGPHAVPREVVQAVVDLTAWDTCWVVLWDEGSDAPPPLTEYAGFQVPYSSERFVSV